ncbi:MAG TPA: tRNA dihydrouridine synthase DusB [bacterium]|nr:tRNA dihydrouridine synthase DusB [bacterium]
MILDVGKLDGKALLAPLAGVADSCFRRICREMGAAVVFTEMVSAEGLIRENDKTLGYLFFQSEERPIGFQLFGANPRVLAVATEMALSRGPDFIDLNFGCPVKKVISRGAGAALMRDPNLMAKIAEAVVKKSTVPVIAKIRKGWDDNSANAVEVATILEQNGIAAITIHPRTRSQQFRGKADWDMIARVKQAVSIPVIGNGDLRSPLDVEAMLKQTGCDLVMIGRASLGNPWIFRDVNHYLNTGQLLPPPTFEERFRVMWRHYHQKIQLSGRKLAILEMRKHLVWYLKGLPGSSQIRAEIFKISEPELIKDTISKYFSRLSEK